MLDGRRALHRERIEEAGMRYVAIGDGYDVKAAELAESCLVDR